jgi:hypothetical protein
MKETGIYATPEEIETLKSALKTPLIALNCGMPKSAGTEA